MDTKNNMQGDDKMGITPKDWRESRDFIKQVIGPKAVVLREEVLRDTVVVGLSNFYERGVIFMGDLNSLKKAIAEFTCQGLPAFRSRDLYFEDMDESLVPFIGVNLFALSQSTRLEVGRMVFRYIGLKKTNRLDILGPVASERLLTLGSMYVAKMQGATLGSVSSPPPGSVLSAAMSQTMLASFGGTGATPISDVATTLTMAPVPLQSPADGTISDSYLADTFIDFIRCGPTTIDQLRVFVTSAAAFKTLQAPSMPALDPTLPFCYVSNTGIAHHMLHIAQAQRANGLLSVLGMNEDAAVKLLGPSHWARVAGEIHEVNLNATSGSMSVRGMRRIIDRIAIRFGRAARCASFSAMFLSSLLVIYKVLFLD